MNKHIPLLLSVVCIVLLSGCTTYIKNKKLDDLDFVSKNYPRIADPNDLAFAYAAPKINIEAEISTELYDGLRERMEYNLQETACHLNGELDKIIVSKGFTITNRFKSYDYMSFTEKRNTTALFYPDITIKIKENSDIKNVARWRFRTYGRLEISAEINILMLEPLSREIIWIKSIPVDEISESFEYLNAYWGGLAHEGSRLRRSPAYSVSRGKEHDVPGNIYEIAKIIDKFFNEIDTAIVDATQRFVEPDELEFLNTDIGKLKQIKRY